VIDTAAIRRELEERLVSLDGEVGELTAVPRDPAAAISFGKRIGDGTNEAIDRLTNVGAAEQLDAMLEDGTYGLCDRCGLSIPDERLEARPWSVLCVRCASLR
jgi:DnaK suppressor protein